MKRPTHKDFYSILGVMPTASPKEIHEAYLGRAGVLHPDRFDPKHQTKDWKKANEMLAELNEAHSILRDANQRREYDQSRAGQQSYMTPPSQPQPSARPETQDEKMVFRRCLHCNHYMEAPDDELTTICPNCRSPIPSSLVSPKAPSTHSQPPPKQSPQKPKPIFQTEQKSTSETERFFAACGFILGALLVFTGITSRVWNVPCLSATLGGTLGGVISLNLVIWLVLLIGYVFLREKPTVAAMREIVFWSLLFSSLIVSITRYFIIGYSLPSNVDSRGFYVFLIFQIVGGIAGIFFNYPFRKPIIVVHSLRF